jgi:membrane protease YdiL (CAAX protease family)
VHIQGIAKKVNPMNTKHTSPWTFFALTFGWSWLFLIPAVLSGQAASASWVALLRYLSGIGPLLTGLLLTYWTRDREGRRDYWRRIVDIRRIPPRWYGVIFLTVPAITALAGLADRLLGGQGVWLEDAAQFVDRPLALLPYTLFILLFGPLPEEMGWRGYALDRLQARWSAPSSSLILGGMWALWHLPLFFIQGTYQHNLGFGVPPSWWTFALNIVFQSVLYTWIYDHTRRSTLSAILFHFMTNYVGQLFELSARAEWFASLLWGLAAILVVLAWRSQRPADDSPMSSYTSPIGGY